MCKFCWNHVTFSCHFHTHQVKKLKNVFFSHTIVVTPVWLHTIESALHIKSHKLPGTLINRAYKYLVPLYIAPSGLSRLTSLFNQVEASIINSNPEKNLELWANSFGTGMPTNFPEFQVIRPLPLILLACSFYASAFRKKAWYLPENMLSVLGCWLGCC